MNKRAPKGFTLLEIMIASMVLAIFTLVGYRVFIAMSRSFQKGSWALATQNKLRNGLHFIREEMQKATYRTDVKVDGTVITPDDFELSLTSATEVTSGKIARWYICLPFVTDDADSPGAVFECELKLENGKLLYSKACIEGSDPLNKEKPLSNYKVVEDVSKIEIEKKEYEEFDEKTNLGSLITMIVTIKHYDEKSFPDAYVSDRTAAKVEVKVIDL